ncbi:hypothetical protein BH10ACT1_BH10ACT1_22580 [soil metagenome]
MTIVAATSSATARPEPGAVDVHLAGLATIRLVGHTPGDLAAVEAQFGTSVGAGTRPADITIRYVERLDGTGPLTYLGPGEAGFTDDGFVVLAGRFRRPVRVRLPFADLGGPCEVVCEHGVGRVPHLVALVNLAVLANGGLALHSSGFELDGTVTIATGWSKGGKSEALAAFCERGARYVGDEWLHLHPDHRVSGIEEPIRVWDWYLDQLPATRARLSSADRRRLAVLKLAARAVDATGRSARASSALRRQRFVDAPADVVATHGRTTEPLPIGRVFLMSSSEQRWATVRPIEGREVADRMAASLAFERAPLLAAVDAFRFAFPAVVTGALDAVPAIERERLHTFLDGVPAAEVVHPYPADLDDLHEAMASDVEEWR